MKLHVLSFIIFSSVILTGCNSGNKRQAENKKTKTIGGVIVNQKSLKEIMNTQAKPEIIAEGFDWSEGPLWLPKQNMLIWSDVPRNTIYKWTGEGVSVYLEPSGYTSEKKRVGETGSNGLLLDENGKLILCQHGDRRIARMEGDIENASANFITLADRFEGKKFNSPNDAAFGPDGNLYFTDPPYGLEYQMEDTLKELDFQGVFKVTPKGIVTLMSKSLTRPNGIAFNKGKTKCYISNSDPGHAVWMMYDINESGDLINERLFFDATYLVEEGNGLPDGLKVNSDGILFASGPGGLLILSAEGEHLGTIHTGSPVSNCAFNEDETVLFMTSDEMIVKIKLTGD